MASSNNVQADGNVEDDTPVDTPIDASVDINEQMDNYWVTHWTPPSQSHWAPASQPQPHIVHVHNYYLDGRPLTLGNPWDGSLRARQEYVSRQGPPSPSYYLGGRPSPPPPEPSRPPRSPSPDTRWDHLPAVCEPYPGLDDWHERYPPPGWIEEVHGYFVYADDGKGDGSDEEGYDVEDNGFEGNDNEDDGLEEARDGYEARDAECEEDYNGCEDGHYEYDLYEDGDLYWVWEIAD